MWRVIKKIFFILVVTILSAAIIAVVGLQLLGYQFRAVQSPSMEPDIPVGAMIVAKKLISMTLRLATTSLLC